VKVAVAASPEVALPTLEWLLKSEHDLSLIISRPDSAVGRGRELTPTAVSVWAQAHQIDLYCPPTAKDFDERLKRYDLVITIGYGILLPQFLLDQPRYGFINLHFSLLPQLRGGAPAQRAIISGLTETGISVFKLEAGMDTGPIYVQQKYQIRTGMTAGDLLVALAELGPKAIEETLHAIENGIEPRLQNHDLATIAPKLTKTEAQLNWWDDAEVIVNKILGFAPNPGCTSKFRGEVLRITNARIATQQLPVGQLLLEAGKVYVGAKVGAVELLQVTPAGKKAMTATAWANGARFKDGEKLE